MKPSRLLFITLAVAACSSAPTQLPSTTSLPPKAATLVAAIPSIEVTFDGTNCTISGETPLTTGEHVFLLHNDSTKRSLLITGRLFKDNHWEDFLQWFEDHCGTPGSICDQSGEAPGVAWLFDTASTNLGLEQRFFQYTLEIEAEYLLVVSWTDGNVWPCGRFRVGASP